ncbi:ParA family protein [Paenibacillus sp. USHLN196]|uniref:ParA family protein n=1 Tax=Paenibacillus sp. USHLN196 TaxID=3081291 RepID=UPI003018818E
MKIITFFNNKGGVGKTTLAVNIASYFSSHYGKKVLFLDADPQANSTQMVVPEEKWSEFYGEDAVNPTLMDFLSPISEGDSYVDFSYDPFPQSQSRFHFDLIPGHQRLSIVEDILSDSWNKCSSGDLGGFRKTNWLLSFKEHFKNYDLMFVDVGPSLGALNRSILLNSDYMVTPMGSDIFSLIGVSNISVWIKSWMQIYTNAIDLLKQKTYGDSALNKHPLNFNLENTTRLVGFSIQQYVTRNFSTGRRAVASYDKIIREIPNTVLDQLGFLIYNDLSVEDLNLGDVPYLYSLVPLAQSNNAPMYDLSYSDGLVGGQIASAEKFKSMISIICEKLNENIGEYR